ncbi:MAG: hypothetical protein WD941_05780, partial [Opitutus sp.]
MPMQQSPAPPQIQNFVNSITARLAQLAKDPPDLLIYLRAHAECVAAALKPVGFAYEMQNGMGFQRVVHGNLESLGYGASPEQEDAFQRAIRTAAEQRRPLLLPVRAGQETGLQGPSAEDSPAPDELPVFNGTPFEQMFIPIPLDDATAGVLHVWFSPGNRAAAQARLGLLKQICGEIELYLKARRGRDVSNEVTRLSTYSRLLEELAGDIDLESVGWNLVNYAREAVACERVCLFIAGNYSRALPGNQFVGGLEYDFELQACSGLKKPHPKSAQAVVLTKVAQKLTEMSMTKALAEGQPQVATTGENPAQPLARLDEGSAESPQATDASAPQTEGTTKPIPPSRS